MCIRDSVYSYSFRRRTKCVPLLTPHKEDDSCGHRRCWTAAASKGLFCVVCVVLVLVAVRFASWTMMAELCFSVDDVVVFFFRSIALLVLISPPHEVRTAAHTASEYDSCGHRRCWTAAAWCPYYSCRRRAKPVGLVMPCGCWSRTRCCALFIVDDDGGALFFG